MTKRMKNQASFIDMDPRLSSHFVTDLNLKTRPWHERRMSLFE